MQSHLESDVGVIERLVAIALENQGQEKRSETRLPFFRTGTLIADSDRGMHSRSLLATFPWKEWGCSTHFSLNKVRSSSRWTEKQSRSWSTFVGVGRVAEDGTSAVDSSCSAAVVSGEHRKRALLFCAKIA